MGHREYVEKQLTDLLPKVSTETLEFLIFYIQDVVIGGKL